MKGKYQDRKVLIMAGKPIGSVDIVKYLNINGAHTIVTDNLAVADSPAKQIAAETWDISTADVDLIADRCAAEKIDAVFTGIHEFNIWRTIDVSERLKLPFYASRTDMLNTSLKTRYKELFRKFDVPVVPESDFDGSIDNIEFPVLVKPVDGSGGQGISICYNDEELKKAYQRALSFSATKQVLVEKFITASEVTIFYIISDGEIMLSAMADRYTGNGNKYTIPLPVLYIFPSKHIDGYIEKLNAKVIAAFKSIGLKNGMVFIQSFADKDEFMFYDIGFRLTGTQEYHILEKICGYNPLKMMVDYSLTGQMGEKGIEHLVDPYFKGKYAFNITLLARPCTVGKYVGIEEVQRMNGVIAVIKNHQEGVVIPEQATGTLNQVVLRVLGISDSYHNMKEMIETITQTVDVLSPDGESVVLPAFKIEEL